MIFASTPAPRQIALAVIAAGLGSSLVHAAKAPVSQADLEKGAVLVVSGEVIEVTSKDQKSEIETGFGWHTDRVFTITLKVGSVVKGDGTVKPGDEITVRAWRPVRRVPALPGLQGHVPIPAKGDTITVYVESIDGTIHEPFLPNGIEIHKATPRAEE